MTSLEEIKALIDPCGFYAIVGHLENDEEIKGLLVVNDPLTLEEAGQTIVDGPTSMLRGWLQNGLIQFVEEIKGGRLGESQRRHPAIKDVAEIPLDRMVYCLYLPPFYVFKETMEQWV